MSGLNSSEKNRSGKRRIIISSVLSVLALGLVLVFIPFPARGDADTKSPSAGRTAAGTENRPSLEKAGERVVLNAADFDNGKAKFFFRDVSGKKVKFFVLKSSDGVIRAAFDACDVCYRAKKGYRQKGDTMVCNNCGQVFASVRINEEKGGCNPSPLQRTIEDGKVYIETASLAEGLYLF